MKRGPKFAWLISASAILFLWWLLSARHYVDPTLLAGPDEVLSRLLVKSSADAIETKNLFADLFATLGRALKGWLFGLLIGFFAGIFIGKSRIGYGLAEPILESLRAIPPILAFPILLVVFGYGDGAYVWTVVFGCAPTMMIAVARGVVTTSSARLETFRVFQKNFAWRLFAAAMEISPFVLLGARIAFSWSLIIAVVCEMVATPQSGLGIGSVARDSEAAFQTPTFYAAALLIGCCGYLGNIVLRSLESSAGTNSNRL